MIWCFQPRPFVKAPSACLNQSPITHKLFFGWNTSHCDKAWKHPPQQSQEKMTSDRLPFLARWATTGTHLYNPFPAKNGFVQSISMATCSKSITRWVLHAVDAPLKLNMPKWWPKPWENATKHARGDFLSSLWICTSSLRCCWLHDKSSPSKLSNLSSVSFAMAFMKLELALRSVQSHKRWQAANATAWQCNKWRAHDLLREVVWTGASMGLKNLCDMKCFLFRHPTLRSGLLIWSSLIRKGLRLFGTRSKQDCYSTWSKQ